MSRWDALKTTDTSHASFKRCRKKNVSSRKDRSHQASFQDPAVTADGVSQHQQQQYDRLRQEYLLSGTATASSSPSSLSHDEILLSLIQCIGRNLDKLSAEKVTNETVYEILLPRLLLLQENHASIQTCILDLLQRFFQNTSYESSIMAPLVKEVSKDGREEQLVNPVRRRLFETLGALLLRQEEKESDTTRRVIATLIVALESAFRIDKTARHANGPYDLAPSLILEVLKLGRRLNDNDDLCLLNVYLKRHPDTAPSFAIFLLQEQQQTQWTTTVASRKTTRYCRHCAFAGASPFLCKLHDEASETAMEVMDRILNHVPLDLWMTRRQRRQQQESSLSLATTMSFPDRFVASLHQVLLIVNCCLVQRQSFVSSRLIETLLTKIPYEESLLDDSCRIVSSLAEQVLNRDDKSSCKADDAIALLVQLCGGRVTPSGNVTSMAVALRRWLSLPNGRAFLEQLLDRENGGAIPVNHRRCRLVRAILRSYPQLVIENEETGRLFDRFVAGLCNCNEHAETELNVGLEVIEGFLMGRSECGEDASTSDTCRSLTFVWSILRSTVSGSTKASAKKLACMCYANMLPDDWNEVARNQDGIFLHLRPLMDLAIDLGVAAKVRTESCKALAMICTQLLSPNRMRMNDKEASVEKTACNELCRTMVRASYDTNASVRCFAVFAIGNLALALEEFSCLLDANLLKEAALRIRDCFEDCDEKVVGNAIRSISHVAVLVRVSRLVDTGFECDAFIQETLSRLSSKVDENLSLRQPSNLTWNQRQILKKQGWGACNAIGRMFRAGLCNEFVGGHVAGILLECIQQHATLNEKIVCSASSALRACEVLSTVASQGAIGECILTCLSLVSSQPSSGSKLSIEMDLLLSHLIRMASIDDAVTVLARSFPSFLYDWMVAHECPPSSFGLFALAAQKGGISVDVDAEVLFSDKALRNLLEEDEEEL